VKYGRRSEYEPQHFHQLVRPTEFLGGLQFQDIKPPLGMFQATKAEKDDTRKLVHTINLISVL